jgi:hypothetical protein
MWVRHARAEIEDRLLSPGTEPVPGEIGVSVLDRELLRGSALHSPRSEEAYPNG